MARVPFRCVGNLCGETRWHALLDEGRERGGRWPKRRMMMVVSDGTVEARAPGKKSRWAKTYTFASCVRGWRRTRAARMGREKPREKKTEATRATLINVPTETLTRYCHDFVCLPLRARRHDGIFEHDRPRSVRSPPDPPSPITPTVTRTWIFVSVYIFSRFVPLPTGWPQCQPTTHNPKNNDNNNKLRKFI